MPGFVVACLWEGGGFWTCPGLAKRNRRADSARWSRQGLGGTTPGAKAERRTVVGGFSDWSKTLPRVVADRISLEIDGAGISNEGAMKGGRGAFRTGHGPKNKGYRGS